MTKGETWNKSQYGIVHCLLTKSDMEQKIKILTLISCPWTSVQTAANN